MGGRRRRLLRGFWVELRCVCDDKPVNALGGQGSRQGRKEMGIESLADDVIAYRLHHEPYTRGELGKLVDIVSERGECDVIVDFGQVDLVTSTSLANLLRLRRMQLDCGRRLILSSVSTFTSGVFSVTGLEGLFELADDVSQAQELLQQGSRLS